MVSLEDDVKRVLFVLATILAGLSTPAVAQEVPVIPFESVPNPLTLPADIPAGELRHARIIGKAKIG